MFYVIINFKTILSYSATHILPFIGSQISELPEKIYKIFQHTGMSIVNQQSILIF